MDDEAQNNWYVKLGIFGIYNDETKQLVTSSSFENK